MRPIYKRLFSLLLAMALLLSAVPCAFAASTTSNVTLFDKASPNYTTVLSSQLTVKYQPNGTDSVKTAYIKNLGWHYAQYAGTAYPDDPIYCIEPCKGYAASTPGNYMDTGVTLTGSGSNNGTNAWYALPQSYREAIMLILLYSDQRWDHTVSVNNTAMANNPNVGLRIATQFLIYEIVCNLRDADSFTRKDSNGYTSGDIFYNAGQQVSGFSSHYNSIVSAIQAAKTIPSFTSASASTAPTITLTGDETSVTDSNGVLSSFSFSDGKGASFEKSGNTLYISQTGDISDSTVFTATRSLPSAGNSSIAVYYGGATTYQTCVRLYQASSGTLNAYFRLKAPAKGSVSIVKNTSDGKNRSGWKFGLYYDAACSSLAAGPYYTDSNGKISVTGITGTFYVKELGHRDSAINSLYTCTSTNPQRVTIANGEVATVTFQNDLRTGNVKLIKDTNTGTDRSGWKVGLYTDSGCTAPISGSPFTIGQDGTITVSGLKPGTYYALELPVDDTYWVCDTAVKTVTVKAGETASVTFTNNHYGRIAIQKHTNTGDHLGGWPFQVRDTEGNKVAELVTDETGYAETGNLPPDRYFIQELPGDDDYWQVELGNHDVTVIAGQTVTDTWYNNEQGLAWFHKETNTDGSAEGWEITTYSDEGCTDPIYSGVTRDNGEFGYYLDPGIYYAKETGDIHGRFTSGYWVVDDSIQRFEVKPHEDVSITFRNTEYGRLKIKKTTDPSGHAEGCQFKVTDEQGQAISGSPFTMPASGEIETGLLLPGKYTVEEIISGNSVFTCESENPQVVTVEPSKTAEVSFLNCMKPGKVVIRKVNSRNEALAGATFLLEWSEDGASWEPVYYSEKSHEKGGCSNAELTDGCLTTGEDGTVTWDGLYPTLYYRVTETAAPEGYERLTDYAFVGELPEKDLTLDLRVVNGRGFVLPETGSPASAILRVAQLASAAGCLALLIWACRKKKR